MRNQSKKNGRQPKARGQPRPPEPKRRQRLPAQAALRLYQLFPANECCALAHSAPEVRSAGCPRVIAELREGDCFVVINCRSECWDGERWARGWTQAVQFRRPDPAYELCEKAAREAEQLTGVAGVVCYIPPGMLPSAPLVPFPDLSQVDLRDLARKPEVC
jgi:hypothetical protein